MSDTVGSMLATIPAQERVARAAWALLPEGAWSTAAFRFIEAGTNQWTTGAFVTSDGGRHFVRASAELAAAWSDLRRLMASEKGAWFSSELAFTDAKGAYSMHHEYEVRPAYHPALTSQPPEPADMAPYDADWAADANRYPRHDDYLPEWLGSLLAERRTFTERDLLIEAKQAAIVQQTFDYLASGPWQALVLSLTSCDGQTDGKGLIYLSGDEKTKMWAPEAMLRDYEQLRELMASPERGAWFRCTVRLWRSSTVRWTFEYDTRVYQHSTIGTDQPMPGEPIVPTDDNYRADFRRFPRDTEHTPEWLAALTRSARTEDRA